MCYAVITTLQLTVSPTFLLAYILHKCVGVTKYALAAPLAYVFAHRLPVLSRVQLPRLRRLSTTSATLPSWAPAFVSTLLQRIANRQSKTSSSSSALQKYGVSFLLASRAVGMATTAVLYLALTYGVDVTAALHTYVDVSRIDGLDLDSMLATVGHLALAVTAAGALFPLGLASVLLAPPLHRLVLSPLRTSLMRLWRR